jgi:hypothetical protein
MSLFPSEAYDSWKTTPDPEPEEELDGYDPDAEEPELEDDCDFQDVENGL